MSVLVLIDKKRGNQKTESKKEHYNGRKKKNQRSTNISTKTKDCTTRTLLKTGDELMCSGRVRNSCSTYDTRRVAF